MTGRSRIRASLIVACWRAKCLYCALTAGPSQEQDDSRAGATDAATRAQVLFDECEGQINAGTDSAVCRTFHL